MLLHTGQRLFNLSQDQANALLGARVKFIDEDGDEYDAITVDKVSRESDGTVYVRGYDEDKCLSDIWLNCGDDFSIRVLELPKPAPLGKFHVESLDQAISLIGKTITVYYEGHAYVEKVLRAGPMKENDGFYFDIDTTEGSWGFPDNDLMVEVMPLVEITPESLDDKIARLRRELAEAEEAKAREGAPEGWRWLGPLNLEGPSGEQIRPHVFHKDFVVMTDENCNTAYVKFDAVAAYVDRVRRDCGEATPNDSAPVSGQSRATEPVIPEGWARGSDSDGPTLRKINGNQQIAQFDRCGETILAIVDEYSELFNVSLSAVRAYIALCDK